MLSLASTAGSAQKEKRKDVKGFPAPFRDHTICVIWNLREQQQSPDKGRKAEYNTKALIDFIIIFNYGVWLQFYCHFYKRKTSYRFFKAFTEKERLRIASHLWKKHPRLNI